jgi:hypothetical protein
VNINDMRALVADCSYPSYAFRVTIDGRGAIYLQGECLTWRARKEAQSDVREN